MTVSIHAAYGLKDLPGPTGRCGLGGGVWRTKLSSSSGTRSNCALAFTQASDLAWNPAKQDWDWEGAKCPRDHSRGRGEETAIGQDFWLQPRRLTAWGETQRLAAG